MSNISSAGKNIYFHGYFNVLRKVINNFVDLNEIKKKFTSPVKSVAIGNQIKAVCKDHINIKSGRCKEILCITWKSDTNEFTFDQLKSSLPLDFFIIQ